MDESLVAALREVADKEAIRAVLWQYAQAIDARDFERVTACFTPDAHAEYSGVARGDTAEAIVDHLRNITRFAKTSHLFANISVRVDGDTALAESSGLSCLLDQREDDGRVYIRGIRYADELRRTETGWAIARRTHHVDWMTVATEVPAGPMW